MAILKSKKKKKLQVNCFTVNKNMKQQIQVKQDYVKLKQIKTPLASVT